MQTKDYGGNSMKRMSLNLSIAVGMVIGLSSLANAHSKHSENFVEGKTVCKGFAPANTMKIPVGQRGSNRFALHAGITEETFNRVLDRVEALYKDEVQALGGTLKVNRRWTDATVNASAQQMGTTWVINMYGGLARHTTITEDGFALVACHEMGHHMGGAPKIDGWYGDSWATNEGGSDYYGTLKCARRYFAQDDNASIVQNMKIDPLAEAKCKEQWSDVTQQYICMRASAAAQSVTALLAELSGDPAPPKFETPDKKVVSKTDDSHPASQCRLDTYYAGVGCKADVSLPVSNTDYRQGTCVAPTDVFGFRPTCWFKPD